MRDNCPICKSKNISQKEMVSRSSELLPVAKCVDCGHVFLQIQYEELYSSGKFTQIARNTTNIPDKKKILALEKKAFERIEFYSDFFEKTDNILEIGSSVGSFVYYLKMMGKKAFGLEPDPDYAEFSEQQYGFSQHCTLLENFESDKKFDTVCSFHVIEHVQDPIVFVQKIADLLNDNGRLLIECPSYEIHSFGKMKETIWKPHLHYYSASSFYKLLSPYFELEKISYYGSSIFVTAKKTGQSKFEESKFKKYQKQSRRVFNMSKFLPEFPPKTPAKLILIELLTQKGKFNFLKSKGLKYGKYKLKEQKFLKNEAGKNPNGIYHVTNYKGWGNNAGDVVLSKCVRDTLRNPLQAKYKIQELSKPVTNQTIEDINKNKLLLIGGGGLFLPDTNENRISGWQWSVSQSQLKEIKIPVVLFAIGYNYFRGQNPDRFFLENLEAILEKASFIGIRNHGSINRINELTNNRFKDKIDFQPCPTTIIRKLYQHLPKKRKSDIIAVNIAFDRPLYRFGNEYDRILSSVALSLKTLSGKGYKIINTTHITADKQFEIVLKRFGVQFRTVELQYEFPEKVFEFYNDAELVIGMRGHAQMIPYGLNTKIITLGSHDKMLWFLQDLEAEDWYIELQNRNADDLYDEILNKSLFLLGEGHENTVQRLINTQNSIFDLTQKNIGKISSFLH